MESAGESPNDEGSESGQKGGTPMLGPLPRLYRSLVASVALVVFIACGIWLAQMLPLPGGGLLLGTSAGLLIAFVLVHDFHRKRAQPARVVRHRPEG